MSRVSGHSIFRLATALYAGSQAYGQVSAQTGAAVPLGDACRMRPVASSPGDVLAGAFRVSSVSLEVTGVYESAPPRAGWSPKDSNLQLVHRAGQKLDREWVCLQFEGYVGRDTTADAIVDLIQKINLAYVANGYINSGVRLLSVPDGGLGAVQLELVFGHVESPVDPAKSLRVTWPGEETGQPQRSGLGTNFVLDRLPSLDRQPFNALKMEQEFRGLAENPAIRLIEGGSVPRSKARRCLCRFSGDASASA